MRGKVGSGQYRGGKFGIAIEPGQPAADVAPKVHSPEVRPAPPEIDPCFHQRTAQLSGE